MQASRTVLELLPESRVHAHAHKRLVLFGFLSGSLVMGATIAVM